MISMRRQLAILCMAALAACGSQPGASAANSAGPATVGSTGTTISAAAVPAGPSAPAFLPPAAQQAWIAYARGYCRQSGLPVDARPVPLLVDKANDPGYGPGFLPADLNGDGRTDYVLITPSGGCREKLEAQPYGTNGGPPIHVLLAAGAGFTVIDPGVGAYMGQDAVKRRNGRDVVVLGANVMGRCGIVSAGVWGWDGAKFDLIERLNDDGQVVDEEGCRVTAAKPATASAGPTGPFGIAAGLYVPAEKPCGSPDADSFYYDGQRISFVNHSRYDPSMTRPVSVFRKRGASWYFADFDIAIKVVNATSLILTDPVMGDGKLRWCAANQVPKSALPR